MEDIFGYLAGTLTTAAFIPQAYKILATKQVKGISIIMYLVFTTGVLLWLIYGLIIANIPMIIFNAVTLILAITILYNLFRYQKNA